MAVPGPWGRRKRARSADARLRGHPASRLVADPGAARRRGPLPVRGLAAAGPRPPVAGRADPAVPRPRARRDRLGYADRPRRLRRPAAVGAHGEAHGAAGGAADVTG